MAYYVTTHDFTHGQIDKVLKARSDMPLYNKGALEIKNMVVRAGGAAKSRFGTQAVPVILDPPPPITGVGVAEGVDYPTPAPANPVGFPNPDLSVGLNNLEPGYQMFDFVPSEELQLLIILGVVGSTPISAPGISDRFVYYVVKNTTGTGPSTGTFNLVEAPGGTPTWRIDNNQVARIKYRPAQNQTDFIIVTGTQPPLRLNWTGSDIEGTTLTSTNPPQHDFSAGVYNQLVGGLPVTFTLSIGGGGVSATDITPAGTPAANLPILTITNLPGVFPGVWSGFWYIFAGPGDDHYVDGIFEAIGPITTVGAPVGVATIVSVTSNSIARVRITSPFDPSLTSGAAGSQVVLTEPAYSGPVTPVTPTSFPGRGQPRTVSFYESRLILAGSESLPQSLFMSQIGRFDNFSTGTGIADEAIAYTIASGSEDQIINMVSGRSLQVFTTTNEFSAPVWSESGLTPETVTIRRQTSIGSSNCIPAVLDNMTIYSKRGGRSMMGYESINTGGNTYNSEDISALSSELINSPIHMTSYVENNAYDSNVLFVINEGIDDIQQRQMIVYESLREQNVAAWTTTSTLGEWENVESVGDQVYFITKRGTGATAGKYVFEKMNWNIVMDGSIECVATAAGPQATIFVPDPAGGAPIPLIMPEMYYEQTIEVVAYVGADPRHPQGLWIDEAQVSNTGVVSISIPQTPSPTPQHPEYPGPISPANPYTYWIGLKFEQKIETMPIDIKTQMGSMLYFKKKIFKVFVQYFESYPFLVNGQEAPLRRLGPPYTPPALQLNMPELPYSGIWMTPTMQKLNLPTDYYVGFVREATVLINSTRPLPLTITGLSMGVG